METTLTLKQIVAAEGAVKKIAAMKLRVAPSFWLSRQLKKLRPEIEAYYDKRNELVLSFGGDTVPKDRVPEFIEQANELLAQQVSLSLETRPPEFLGDVEIEPGVLADLWFLFDTQSTGKKE